MIKAGGDSWAFSSVKGFPKKKLDWFAAAPAKRPTNASEWAINQLKAQFQMTP